MIETPIGAHHQSGFLAFFVFGAVENDISRHAAQGAVEIDPSADVFLEGGAGGSRSASSQAPGPRHIADVAFRGPVDGIVKGKDIRPVHGIDGKSRCGSGTGGARAPRHSALHQPKEGGHDGPSVVSGSLDAAEGLSEVERRRHDYGGMLAFGDPVKLTDFRKGSRVEVVEQD